jgi:hypothetical protein
VQVQWKQLLVYFGQMDVFVSYLLWRHTSNTQGQPKTCTELQPYTHMCNLPTGEEIKSCQFRDGRINGRCLTAD